MLIVQGVLPLGGVKQWWGGENWEKYFVAKCVGNALPIFAIGLWVKHKTSSARSG